MDNILFAGGEAACARIQIEGEPTAALLNQMRAAPAILALSVTRLA
jgi:hypothetical protein